MNALFGTLFSAVLVNNLALTYLVGLDLQVAASKRINAAFLMGILTTVCLSLILPATYLTDQLLIIPFSLQYLDLLFYMMLIMLTVFSIKNLTFLLFPLLEKTINSAVPLLLMNSVLLIVILLNQAAQHSFLASFLYGFCTGIGFLFLLLVLACLRERIDNEDIPESFRGLPILLISLGIFSMGLMGLAGL